VKRPRDKATKVVEQERAARRAKERELTLVTIQRDQMKRDLDDAARRIGELRTRLEIASGGAPPRVVLAGSDVESVARAMRAHGFRYAQIIDDTDTLELTT
jgi:CBS domain-containing protein